jgi:hypothetical protein
MANAVGTKLGTLDELSTAQITFVRPVASVRPHVHPQVRQASSDLLPAYAALVLVITEGLAVGYQHVRSLKRCRRNGVKIKLGSDCGILGSTDYRRGSSIFSAFPNIRKPSFIKLSGWYFQK